MPRTRKSPLRNRGNQHSARASQRRSRGFTLLEMMVSMGIFLLIFASAFTLLGVSQQRYQSESQVLNSFEEARLGLDQIVRDWNDAGYPPQNQFQSPPTDPTLYADTPVAWSPGYPNVVCSMQGLIHTQCVSPAQDGMFIETNPTPQTPGVQYIRYKLGDTSTTNTTLFRGVIPKPNPVTDPYLNIATDTLVPFVQNVMNHASPAQIAQINAQYPNMFPGGNPVPIFTYMCDTPIGPKDCSTASPDDSPTNIRSVTITLIVATPTPDPQTGRLRIIELTGRASRINTFQ